MEELNLGPNGALIYCMRHLETHIEWLEEQLEQYKDCYLLFDFPGQVELYTNEDSVRNILQYLTKKLNLQLTVIHLVDSTYCLDGCRFISLVMTSLISMIQLELPHVNILSKIDLMEKSNGGEYDLDMYTDVLDLRRLLDSWLCHENDTTEFDPKEDIWSKRFYRMQQVLVEVIEDFSLVSFHPLNIEDGKNVLKVLKTIDKANGYVIEEGRTSSE